MPLKLVFEVSVFRLLLTMIAIAILPLELIILCLSTCFIFLQLGSVYKLAFGPKSFVVISDPIVARHILRENTFSYDKASCSTYKINFVACLLLSVMIL